MPQAARKTNAFKVLRVIVKVACRAPGLYKSKL
jgi:hypothetical protein